MTATERAPHRFLPLLALFRNFDINHAFGVTGLESLVQRTRVRLRTIP
jgi:hypothetical protein